MLLCRICRARVDPLGPEALGWDIEDDTCAECSSIVSSEGEEAAIARAAGEDLPYDDGYDDDGELVDGDGDGHDAGDAPT